MHATLGASGASLQLVVAGYTIAYAVLLVTGARLGDILGHRRVFLAGVPLFTLASLGCGLAPTTGVLVALRFLQGAGAATMIPQVLSLIQRTYTAPGPRARAMSLYATVISGGSVLGQVLGGLLVSANLFGSSGGRSSSSTSRSACAVLACGRLLPAGRFDGVRTLDLPGLRCSPRPCSRFVLPLVLGQPLGWPLWGWLLLAASVGGLRPARRGGAPGGRARRAADPAPLAARAARHDRRPRRAVRVDGDVRRLAVRPGARAAGRPRRSRRCGPGSTFVPCGVAFALVSLNWRRLPAPLPRERLPVIGFVVNGAGLVWSGLLLHSGGDGGAWLYVALAVSGGGMAGAFGALMARVLSRVPVAIAADASGVIVTVNQLGIVTGIAAFGSLYLNLAGRLPAVVGPRQLSAFALSSGHAYLAVAAALAALGARGRGARPGARPAGQSRRRAASPRG